MNKSADLKPHGWPFAVRMMGIRSQERKSSEAQGGGAVEAVADAGAACVAAGSGVAVVVGVVVVGAARAGACNTSHLYRSLGRFRKPVN